MCTDTQRAVRDPESRSNIPILEPTMGVCGAAKESGSDGVQSQLRFSCQLESVPIVIESIILTINASSYNKN